MIPLGTKGILKYEVGIPETLFYVAAVSVQQSANVAALQGKAIAFKTFQVGMHRRRSRFERIQRVHHRFQVLILHFNQTDRFLGGHFIVGSDGGNRLTDIIDFIPSHYVPVFKRSGPEVNIRKVPPGDNPAYPWQGFRL